MAIVLKCPICREKFKYDVSQGWPDFCVVCGEDINNRRADDDVVMPNILSYKTKNNDKVARDIMDGSERRAEMAAELAGCSVSDMSALKVTNLNDRNDTQFAAVEVNNSVTQHMQAMQQRGMPIGYGSGPADAQSRATMAHADVEPYAGLRARNQLQRILPPVAQPPLPAQITNNPNYRSPV